LNRSASPRSRAALAARASAPPSDAVGQLQRILRYELSKGCDDSAVIGGLDRYLANAAADPAVARLLAGAPRLARGYRALPGPARRAWIERVLRARPVPVAKARPPVAARTAPAVPAAGQPEPAPLADPLDAPVTVIRGVKAAFAERLAKLGVTTVRDLVFLFPNRHNDFADIRTIAQLRPGEEQTCAVQVLQAQIVRLGRMYGTEAKVHDGTGVMRVVWFNQTYLADQLKPNDRIVLAGRVGLYQGLKTMESPEWERLQGEELTHTGRIVPVYPMTQGLNQRRLRAAVKEAVDRFAALVPEALPEGLRQAHGLSGITDALRQMHYPDTMDDYRLARRRLAFEELLCVQLAVLDRRLAWQEGRAPAFDSRGIIDVYRSALPFALTGAQERVIGEITADLASTRPMARLLQGDVGSGKTAVAAAAMVVTAANGYQAAIMAPTEILAEQHYRTLTSLLKDLTFADRPRLRIELLTGSKSGAERRKVLQGIERGEVDVAVGTHALIQEGVTFAKLGLTVVDEQHRFGVMQRAALRERAAGSGRQTPHLLVMSATPIPRTLALTFFGDLDVSVIDELPPGRQPVLTRWVPPEDRAEAYDFVREEVRRGRQAFIVCPLIEESQSLQTKAATQEYEFLSREVFPDLKLGLLHGRIPSPEKDRILSDFRDRAFDILVATTVIEVGIDIPNATVMLIEGADRFGLAQLHQLRGRVGRGGDRSYCLLLAEEPSESARERLEVLARTNDGFELAEADLRIRGPGDYFGTRQSGLPEFQAADFSDIRLIETARREAKRLLDDDPGLALPEHLALAKEVARLKRVVTGEVS
jgi:ATP-dependent DNA helicase RecG